MYLPYHQQLDQREASASVTTARNHSGGRAFLRAGPLRTTCVANRSPDEAPRGAHLRRKVGPAPSAAQGSRGRSSLTSRACPSLLSRLCFYAVASC